MSINTPSNHAERPLLVTLEDWLEICRSYTAAELAAEIASLQNSVRGGFVNQGSGSVQNQRDLTELRDRLRAAVRVQSVRSGSAASRLARADFSATTTADF